MTRFNSAILLCVLASSLVHSQYGDSEIPPPEENPCNLVDCIPNTQCILENGQPKCVPFDYQGDNSTRTCPPNEEYNECGTACEPSCRNPNPTICTLQCVIGCQCKKGFYRDDNNTCVETCPEERNCTANEELKSCGTACEPTCSNPNPVCTEQCIIDVCQCKPGYIRRSDGGPCIPNGDCPTDGDNTTMTCPPNEEYTMCGTACEPSCKNPNPTICTLQCVIGCQCKKGFYRDDNNTCVETCPEGSGCGTNEELKSCGTACEPTCTNPNPVCTRQCVVDVCQCKPGYIRRSDGGPCISLDDCPIEPIKPCSELDCPPGMRCELGRVICPFVPPCFTRQSQCVPITPPSSPPPTYYKVPERETCETKQCPPGTTCHMAVINCVRAPCPQPKPECIANVPTLPPCSQIQCAPGVSSCTIPCRPDGLDNSTMSSLEPVDPDNSTMSPIEGSTEGPTLPLCSQIHCVPGTKCLFRCQPDYPDNSTMSSLEPQKTDNSTTSSFGGSTGEPYNPCAATTCPVGWECRVKEVQCIRAPCYPVAECVPPPQNNQCGPYESFKECSSQCEPNCSNKAPVCIQSCGPPRCQCSTGFFRNSSGSCVTEAECDSATQTPSPEPY